MKVVKVGQELELLQDLQLRENFSGVDVFISAGEKYIVKSASENGAMVEFKDHNIEILLEGLEVKGVDYEAICERATDKLIKIFSDASMLDEDEVRASVGEEITELLEQEIITYL